MGFLGNVFNFKDHGQFLFLIHTYHRASFAQPDPLLNAMRRKGLGILHAKSCAGSPKTSNCGRCVSFCKSFPRVYFQSFVYKLTNHLFMVFIV